VRVSLQDLQTGLTYDDVLPAPKYSEIGSRRDVSTKTRFSRNISLNIPIISANMIMVTESSMAIALARLGGLGVIHRFMPVGDQVAEVTKVKRSEGIVIEDPITLSPVRTVGRPPTSHESMTSAASLLSIRKEESWASSRERTSTWRRTWA